MKDDIKNRIRNTLEMGRDAKIPTSSVGRLGRMALTALRGGAMVVGAGRNEDGELAIDTEKIVKMVTSVGKLKGIAMKMGQIMSYIDIAMPEEMQEALSVLQTHCQPMPFDTVETVVREELGEKGEALLSTMDRAPVSSASIGQVHVATVAGEKVAVKVQYPEMKKAIASDFSPAAAGTRFASLFYPGARVDEYVKEARTRFLEECDYIHEAHCQQVFRNVYDKHPVLYVPRVYPAYCAERVLATEFIEGRSFSAFLETDPPQALRNTIGTALFEFYIGSLFLHHIYNCDPHPGNYLFREDGTVAMLDHGCTREFEPSFVAALALLTKAVHRDEQALVHAALLRLKIVREGKKYDYGMIRGFLRGFYGPMLVDETARIDVSSAMAMKDVFKKKQQLMKFSLPGEFTFLFRIRFGLMSVLAKLGSEANWYRLEQQYIDAFEAKYPLLLGGV